MDSPYTCLYPQVFLLGGIAGHRLLAEKEKIQTEQGAEGCEVQRCNGAAAAMQCRCPHLIHSRSISPLLPPCPPVSCPCHKEIDRLGQGRLALSFVLSCTHTHTLVCVGHTTAPAYIQCLLVPGPPNTTPPARSASALGKQIRSHPLCRYKVSPPLRASLSLPCPLHLFLFTITSKSPSTQASQVSQTVSNQPERNTFDSLVLSSIQSQPTNQPTTAHNV